MKGLRAVVFNNPFDSFHNTVAEAKEEREQLDRLLTISTPRERLLVAAIALFLLILAGWLFFGSVSHSLAIKGVVVAASQGTREGERSLQALVWIERDVAPQIEAGMPAAIELGGADGGADALHGLVADISAVPQPEALAAFASAAPVSMHRVLISFRRNLDVASLAGRECRMVIELGRQSPIAFFLSGRL